MFHGETKLGLCSSCHSKQTIDPAELRESAMLKNLQAELKGDCHEVNENERESEEIERVREMHK